MFGDPLFGLLCILLSMTYPLHPNTVTKKKYYELDSEFTFISPSSQYW